MSPLPWWPIVETSSLAGLWAEALSHGLQGHGPRRTCRVMAVNRSTRALGLSSVDMWAGGLGPSALAPGPPCTALKSFCRRLQ